MFQRHCFINSCFSRWCRFRGVVASDVVIHTFDVLVSDPGLHYDSSQPVSSIGLNSRNPFSPYVRVESWYGYNLARKIQFNQRGNILGQVQLFISYFVCKTKNLNILPFEFFFFAFNSIIGKMWNLNPKPHFKIPNLEFRKWNVDYMPNIRVWKSDYI